MKNSECRIRVTFVYRQTSYKVMWEEVSTCQTSFSPKIEQNNCKIFDHVQTYNLSKKK